MRVSDVLADKGSEVLTATPVLSVADAINAMVEHNIGALPVQDPDGKLIGIISERDILRLLARGPASFAAARVSDCMTRHVYVARATDPVDDSLMVMNAQRIRHLPVIDSGQLIGLVSQGDLVKAKLEVAEFVNRHLTDFVMGKYPA